MPGFGLSAAGCCRFRSDSGALYVAGIERAASHHGEGNPMAQQIVRAIRLPRVLTAVFVGGALGISGAIFQCVSRNALGSPDVIGFTTGAATGAIVQIVLLNGNTVAIVLSAMAGGWRRRCWSTG